MGGLWAVALVDGARLRELAPGVFEVVAAGRRAVLGVTSAGVLGALTSLATSGGCAGELRRAVRDREGDEAAALFDQIVRDLDLAGLVRHRIEADGRAWITCEPANAEPPKVSAGEPAAIPHVLGGYVLLRRVGRDLVLESPRTMCRFRLHEPSAVAFVASLAVPRIFDEALAVGPGNAEAKRLALQALASTGLWVPADSVAATRSGWEFHDLVFHCRSRQGYRDAPYGSVAAPDALPNVSLPREWPDADIVELVVPALPTAAGLTLHDALEGRRSVRGPGTRAVRVDELAELLHRAVAVRDSAVGARHVFPTAGGLGELAVYPLVTRCEGLEPGLWAYDAQTHRLARRSEMSDPVERLVRSAGRAASSDAPDVLLVVTACMPRAWSRYRAVAYANVLKDVGALFQTLYLVAGAMGLAPCAIGGGDARAFAAASGTDPDIEPAVGEFMLSGR